MKLIKISELVLKDFRDTGIGLIGLDSIEMYFLENNKKLGRIKIKWGFSED